MSERYTLRIAKTAEKDLLDLQPKQYKQVVSKILSLQGNPRPQDYAALKGYQGGYRIDRWWRQEHAMQGYSRSARRCSRIVEV